MRPTRDEWYIGIEAGRQWTQVSCYHVEHMEPETKSTLAGSELYQIPTAICKRKQTGQWCFGEEGRKLAEAGEGYYAGDLLNRAFQKETVSLDRDYEAQELLSVFFRKVLRLALPAQGPEAVTKCVFSLEKITEETVGLFQNLVKKLGLKENQVLIQDHRESFYAYVVSQDPALWNQQVLLFEEEGNGVVCRLLCCSRKTKPFIAETGEAFLGRLPENEEERDRQFCSMVKKVLEGRIVSAVYLIGCGFEGDWMKESLRLVCQNRRAFRGKNLYTRGACYSGLLQTHQEEAETVYFSDYKIKETISLKSSMGDEEFFFLLAEAGTNRHQVGRRLRIILEEEPVLDLWIQKPGSQEARIESLELPGLLLAKQERARLALSLWQAPGDRIFIKLQDIGFGTMKPGSRQEWEYEILKKS